jgi:DnaK suppressor protein
MPRAAKSRKPSAKTARKAARPRKPAKTASKGKSVMKKAAPRRAAPKGKSPKKPVRPSKASVRSAKPKSVSKAVRPKAPARPRAAAAQARVTTIAKTTKEAPVAKVKQVGMRAVRETLLKRRDLLQKNLGRLSAGTQAGEKPVGDRADDASLDLEVDSSYSIAEHEAEELRLIDVALGKVANGTYGVCEECGAPIERPRLKALPYAVLCLKCKQAEEVERVEKPAVNYGEIEEE